MYFLRKKKQQRDREAGLIFPWRGSRKHHLGKMVAFLVAMGFFAFSVYAIKIEGIKSPLLSNRKGVVVMLDEHDPECQKLMFQIEQRSPFPARWDPAFDQNLQAGLRQATDGLQGGLWQYDAALLPMPEVKERDLPASIIEPDQGLLGRVSGVWRQVDLAANARPAGDLLIRAKVTALGGIKGRVKRDELALPVDLVADDWFGQTFRFYIRLDDQGVVTSCVPLLGGTLDAPTITDRQKNLAAWIRTQRFASLSSNDGDTGFGQLQLQIEASRE